MRATYLEFRLRIAVFAAIFILGFWAPWIGVFAPPTGFASRVSTLEWLATILTRLGLLSFTQAAPFVIVMGSLVAALAVILRLWGAACLDPSIVQHHEMHSAAVVAAGPYRFVRNPLYIGTWCVFASASLVMPPSGMLVSMVLASFFLFRLILGEEAFLSARLGQPYLDYCRAVPRLIPRLRAVLPPVAVEAHWLRAIASELFPIGIFVTVAVVSWSYNNDLMGRAILISFGISLVARAFVRPPATAQSSQSSS